MCREVCVSHVLGTEPLRLLMAYGPLFVLRRIATAVGRLCRRKEVECRTRSGVRQAFKGIVPICGNKTGPDIKTQGFGTQVFLQ